jgi:autophagy-related protein 18
MGYLSKAVTTGASYLPAQVTDTLNQTRSVATVTVPNTSPASGASPNTVAIATVSGQTRLLLASSDGYLYIYNLPGKSGNST